ncbi:hypothetical protein [Stieleria varia]|uniref:Uncharacterized protein n=1 Tax=Stieleria varia TaxID=2528005 RepID=A0A5C5ZYQ6_9BACT|nr:hypothetical protein [Stieleria varia]TWT92409.1 hypothetical protein Pla52n_62830 [Stieleria varia]
MSGLMNWKAFVLAAVVATVSLTQAGNASAGDHYYQPDCYWKTVTVYESIKKPYTAYVTKYDHCGHPYQAKVVRYKTVQVPVTKRIKVCH